MFVELWNHDLYSQQNAKVEFLQSREFTWNEFCKVVNSPRDFLREISRCSMAQEVSPETISREFTSMESQKIQHGSHPYLNTSWPPDNPSGFDIEDGPTDPKVCDPKMKSV